MGSPCVPGIDQSINISVDRLINQRSGIDDRTGPENMEVERRKKNTFKSSHLTNEDRWIDRPELPGDFWVLSGGFRGNMDRSIYPRFGG